MKIAISNIAWDYPEDEAVASILQKYNIEGIEIAPTKIWIHPNEVSTVDVKAYKHYWKTKNIAIVAMQSLLFGHPEFHQKIDREELLTKKLHKKFQVTFFQKSEILQNNTLSIFV